MEAAGVLVEHQELEILQAAQRGGVRHVGVQDAARLRQALVQLGMQVPGGRVRRVRALQRGRVARIEQQQLAGADPRESGCPPGSAGSDGRRPTPPR
jgi:hypothetical protein